MTRRGDPPEVVRLLAATSAAQGLASEPTASAWVSANAGSGKTHVLKLRVLRLLLAGSAPERILCLTYTKAAAAEMARRVGDELSHFATLPDADLAAALRELTGRPPLASDLMLARQLFARVIDAPGGLKIETIHAFSERLLRRFPLESGVPAGFTVLDEAEEAGLKNEAVVDVLETSTAPGEVALKAAVEAMVAHVTDDRFERILRSAIKATDWLDGLERYHLRRGGGDLGGALDELYRGLLELTAADTPEAIRDQIEGLLNPSDLRQTIAALSKGAKSDLGIAADLKRALAAAPGERHAAFESVFMTKGGEPRSRLTTKGVAAAEPQIAAKLDAAQARFVALNDQLLRLRLIEATIGLATLALAARQGYGDLKREQASLDFDDLVVRSARLLSDPAIGAWVQHKLDGGIDHILVDEAQDTSPEQWRIISALSEAFFAPGAGRALPRTVFAVGDDKQSIFSFQGARPERFRAVGHEVEERAREARLHFHKVPLSLSFRTVPPLLDAVDRVFADAGRTPGIAPEDGPVRHQARRHGDAALIEVWEPERPGEPEAEDPFAPLGSSTDKSPARRLAERIGRKIKGWLERGEILAATGRPVRPGDILILLRRRKPFAEEMIRALKACSILVAGADRMEVAAQLAVEDLIALGDVLLLPEDDLSLAVTLKSPLFGLADEDLERFAVGRAGSLWQALVGAARQDPRLAAAVATLTRWREDARTNSPFEVYSRILDRDGGRLSLIGRLGPEAADAIEEFHALALKSDDRAAPSLVRFLGEVRASTHELKRDMDHGRDQVRVMTVHGAKGLEAPIVFLPDTCAAPAGRSGGDLLELRVKLKGLEPLLVWPVKGTSRIAEVEAAQCAVAEAERQELDRLLYVALTRARDRLYVAGFEGRRSRPLGCWYNLITDGLEGYLAPGTDEEGFTVSRHATAQVRAAEAAPGPQPAEYPLAPMPDFLTPTPPPAEGVVRIAPSRLGWQEEGEFAAGAAPEGASPLELSRAERRLKGTLTHTLFQYLPGVAPQLRAAAAAAFLATRGRDLDADTRRRIAAGVAAVMADPAFGDCFGPGSRGEVPIHAEVAAQGGGPPLVVSGAIDRLVRAEGRTLIVDFKTNRAPPSRAEDTPAAYLGQLAAYRLALRAAEPGVEVEAAILWTEAPRLMAIPSRLLDRAEKRLFGRQGSAR